MLPILQHKIVLHVPPVITTKQVTVKTSSEFYLDKRRILLQGKKLKEKASSLEGQKMNKVQPKITITIIALIITIVLQFFCMPNKMRPESERNYVKYTKENLLKQSSPIPKDISGQGLQMKNLKIIQLKTA